MCRIRIRAKDMVLRLAIFMLDVEDSARENDPCNGSLVALACRVLLTACAAAKAARSRKI